jgi:imidazolonepropionase-like amidohydrolase
MPRNSATPLTRPLAPCRGLTPALALALALGSFLAGRGAEAQSTPPSAILFENVRVFDGTSDALSPPSNVLVVGNTIQAVSTEALTPPAEATLTRIEGEGRTLMPGLIDAHVHMVFSSLPQLALLTADLGFVNLVAGRAATDMLMRGFTSVRDLGGPVFGLKRAIDQGVLPGPRIWPSGAFISQSGGHGDFRLPTELPANPAEMSYSERIGAAVIADDPDLVRRRAREQLQLGASQLKLMAGGGVSSAYDPLDVTQYTVPELRAAVEAAENWGTYVAVHAYTPRAVRQALEAGVRVIDHGHLLDEETVRAMAEADVWWSLQPFTDDRPSAFPEGSPNRIKQRQLYAGTDSAFAMARRFGVKTAWGTDILFDADAARRQNLELTKMVRWYSPAEVLRMATSGNAALLGLSGLRSPYPGRLGVVEEGALADLLLVDGDPLADIRILEDPENRLLVIVKGGVIHKNAGV